MISGCGNKKDSNNTTTAPQAPNKKIETIIENLAKAALKDDMKEMTKFGNELEKEFVRPKEITISADCAELTYVYENKEQKYKYCKK